MRWQELNTAFPPDRRDIAAIPGAGFSLDGMAFSEVKASPFGQAVDAWLTDVLRLDRFLNTPFCDGATRQPHTLTSWLLLLREMMGSG